MRAVFHGLDALGDHAQAEGLGQADDGADQVQVFALDQHVAHEALVYLQHVGRQPL